MPEMRASQLKEDLLALPALGNEIASRILASVSPSTLRQIEHAARVDWLPMELDLELVEAVLAATGEDGVRLWVRSAVSRSFETWLFRPLFGTVVSIFGLSPAALLRAAPQAWRSTFRGCGELVVADEGERMVRLALRSLPPLLQTRGFAVSIAGALEAPVQACRVQGQVVLQPGAAGQDVALEVRWSS